MKFAIIALALIGFAVAQNDGSVHIVCRDHDVVQDAFLFFGTGLSDCHKQPLGQYIGYRCKFMGHPQKLYIKFLLTERNRLFAPALTVHTQENRFTPVADPVDCVTCNTTEYEGLDTSKCNAETYWNTDDLDKGTKCLANDFPSNSPSIVTNTYYYKMPLNPANIEAGSKIQVDVKVGQGDIVCSTLVELLPN